MYEQEAGPNDRLDSWKTIAGYLGRDVRTVQLWEKSQCLPIHRQRHTNLSSVFAFKSELDHWRNQRTSKPSRLHKVSVSLGGISTANLFGRRHGAWRASMLSVLLCVGVLLCSWLIWGRGSLAGKNGNRINPLSPDSQTQEEYLRGRHFLAMRNAEGMREALGYFQLAVQRDPQYAQAYVGLAETHNLLGMYELERPSESLSKVKDSVEKALRLNSGLAEAYTARAIAASSWEFDWDSAERDFQHSLAINPNSAETHHWYGEHLINLGLAERAVLELKRARELDPISLSINCTLGRVYRDAHRYHEAIAQCQNTVHLAPKFSMGHWCLGQAYASEQHYTLALSELELANSLGSTPLILCDLGCLYARMGRKKEAQAILRQFQQNGPSAHSSAYLIGAIWGALEEPDRAFAWLNRALTERDPHVTYFALDPRLDVLRSDRRFPVLIEQLKLPKPRF